MTQENTNCQHFTEPSNLDNLIHEPTCNKDFPAV